MVVEHKMKSSLTTLFYHKIQLKISRNVELHFHQAIQFSSFWYSIQFFAFLLSKGQKGTKISIPYICLLYYFVVFLFIGASYTVFGLIHFPFQNVLYHSELNCTAWWKDSWHSRQITVTEAGESRANAVRNVVNLYLILTLRDAHILYTARHTMHIQGSATLAIILLCCHSNHVTFPSVVQWECWRRERREVQTLGGEDVIESMETVLPLSHIK